MRFLLVLLCTILVGNPKEDFDLVISNPKIINTENGSILTGHDILIKGNVIINIIAHKTSYNKAVKLVDAHEMYAIPGLWDMHVHALWTDWFEICNPLMVSYGVTGFRDTWGDLKLADTVRKKMAIGEIPFQRFILAGGLIDGAPPIWPQSQVADSPERGIQLVDSLHKEGANFIKVYSRLTPETFLAIAKRCKELNIEFVGHVPQKVRLEDASNAGMYSMEHLYGFTEAFSDQEDSIFAILDKIDFAKGDPHSNAALSAQWQKWLLKTDMDPQKVDKVCTILKQNHTWIVPTLVVRRGISYMDVLDTVKDERLADLPLDLTGSWKVSEDFRVKNRTPQQWEDAKKMYEKALEQFVLLYKHNIPFLAGSDMPNPYCFPGSGIHDEFELMKQQGLSALQILQTATLNPAKYLHKTDSLGTIAPNKYADILLLGANPLENVSNIKKIKGLCDNGRYYDKQDLDALRKKARELSEKMNRGKK